METQFKVSFKTFLGSRGGWMTQYHIVVSDREGVERSMSVMRYGALGSLEFPAFQRSSAAGLIPASIPFEVKGGYGIVYSGSSNWGTGRNSYEHILDEAATPYSTPVDARDLPPMNCEEFVKFLNEGLYNVAHIAKIIGMVGLMFPTNTEVSIMVKTASLIGKEYPRKRKKNSTKRPAVTAAVIEGVPPEHPQGWGVW